MKENNSNRVPLSEFFAAVERRLARLTEPGDTSFQVMVCGQVIELRFLTEEYAKEAIASLAGRVCTGKHKPDAVFCYWTDDLAQYISPEDRMRMLKCKEAGRYFFYNHGFIGADMATHTFYRCLPGQDAHSRILSAHALYELFFLWARTMNMFMLHAAAVGVKGKGVLITGKGGSGKSTLSISCLLEGMDFVADDYTLISGQGQLFAFPLYTSVLLNPDMAQQLEPDMPVTYVNPARGNRLCFDASSHLFCPHLEIGAVIAPVVDNCEMPYIKRTLPGNTIARMIYSTVRQMGIIRDPEPVRAIAERFLNVPVYEMHLSTDLEENIRVLREFIKEDL